jgi:NAD(P) transhydrogenase subunit alpha
VAGYRAVLEAAHLYGGFFGLQVTAAGRAEPAKVLIIGGGVAGLAALGAARNLGAQVRAFDTRPAVREQVESLGGEFIEFHFDESGEGEGGYAKQMSDAYLEAEQRLLAKHAAECDIVISTALIPGKPAPVLLTAEAALAMRPGSVVVDLAAERGGNCPLTEADKIVTKGGVTFVGLTDLPSRMARQSSELYGMNIVHMLDELKPKGKEFALDHSNEVIRGSLYAQDGTVLPPPPKPNPSPAPKAEAPKPTRPPEDKPSGSAAPPATAHAPEVKAPSAPVSKPASAPAKKQGGHGHGHGASEGGGLPGWAVGLIGAALIGLGAVAPTEFLQHLTVFLLACVVGWHVVWSVTAALHTPLMSVTNAISGIILIGGMLLVRGQGFSATTVLGLVAILVASINVAGGFLVTRRMLDMFRK